MKQVVIMPGGFHPFHPGHLDLYKQAQAAFPGADVYVAATNDTSTRPFPFAVKEKLATLAGVKPGHFIQVKSPFKAEEITKNYDANNTQLIFVRSDKDTNKPPQAGGVKKDGSPAYLQPLAGQKKLEPMNRHAYMGYLKTKEFLPGMTGASDIRAEWPGLDAQTKLDRVMSLYPATTKNPKLAATVVKLLDLAIMGEELNEISFFKPAAATPPEETPQQKPLGYRHLFKPDEPPKELPKQYHSWQEYEADQEQNKPRPDPVKESIDYLEEKISR